jgi:hypothetical protein
MPFPTMSDLDLESSASVLLSMSDIIDCHISSHILRAVEVLYGLFSVLLVGPGPSETSHLSPAW